MSGSTYHGRRLSGLGNLLTECARKGVYVRVCMRERASVRERVRVTERERKRERECVRESERKRECERECKRE